MELGHWHSVISATGTHIGGGQGTRVVKRDSLALSPELLGTSGSHTLSSALQAMPTRARLQCPGRGLRPWTGELAYEQQLSFSCSHPFHGSQVEAEGNTACHT